VKDLLGRMTLEEKVAQLQSRRQNYGQHLPADAYFVDASGNLDVTKAMLRNGLGEFSRPSEAMAGADRLQNAGPAAMADVLFGDYNPAGRLPISGPRSVGQLPNYYYMKPTAKRGYLFADKTPLFPFGFGLSYTTFGYTNLRVTPAAIPASGTVTVQVDVTNTGKRASDEVVQLYVRDEVSSVTGPVKELRGFERVSLKAGETRTVSFKLGADALQFYNRNMKRVVEPGKFTVMVGPNSVELKSATFEVKP